MNKEPTNQPMKKQVNEGTTYSGPNKGKMLLEAAALLHPDNGQPWRPFPSHT